MHGVARGSLDIKIAFAKIAFRFYVKLSPWTGSWTHAVCRICTALRTKPQNWPGLRGFPLACPLFMTCFLLRSGFKIPECRHARMHGQGRCWDWASSLSLGTGNARRSELAKSSVRFVFPVFSLHAEFCSARRMGMIELQGDKARRGWVAIDGWISHISPTFRRRRTDRGRAWRWRVNTLRRRAGGMGRVARANRKWKWWCWKTARKTWCPHQVCFIRDSR